MNANEFLELEDDLNQKQRERDKFLGKKETLSDQLKNLGYKTLNIAEEALSTMEQEIEQDEQKLEESFSDFKNKFGNLL